MAQFRPQNLVERVKQEGKNLVDYVEEQSKIVKSAIETTGNISIEDGFSSIESGITEVNKAVTQELTNFTVKPAVGALGKSSAGPLGQGPIENYLGQFKSFNYIFTLGCLTNDEVNFPDSTYRKYGMSNIILRSGGTGNSQVRTAYEKQLGITGEYFIDNVTVDTIIAPNQSTKQTNATSLAFEVMEPYSMGLFLQTLQLAALQAGHKNYLEAPYMLMVEFIGWDSNDKPINLQKSKRMFPLKFTNTTFNVQEGGSVYTVSAIPWHEQAFADETQAVKTDIDIKGDNVIELLQTGPESLATILNNRELELQKTGNKTTADQYVILFPTSRSTEQESLLGSVNSASGATTESANENNSSSFSNRTITEEQQRKIAEQITGIKNGDIPKDFDAELSKILGIVVKRSALGESIREYAEKLENVNAIGKSVIAKSYLDSGKPYFSKPKFVESEDNPGTFSRGGITISDSAKRISFKKGARVQDIIEEVILLSEYGRKFATENSNSEGFKKWFRIEADVYNVSDSKNVKQTGTSPKVYVYRIVPFEVNESRLNNPTQTTKGIKKLKSQALKEYNYIYTGKNDDIISFDIQINSSFFAAINSDMGQQTQDQVTGSANNLATQPVHPIYGLSTGNSENLADEGNAKSKDSGKSGTGNVGGGPQVHPETQIARAFNDAILNSNVDLITAQLEIWGDPYYIADSGMGNYNASEIEGSRNITADGTMDYQSSEVDIVINFRTPVDIGKDGYMKFPSLDSKPVSAFSGLYQVTLVTNSFSSGQFTQTLELIRRKNQEGNAPAVDEGKSLLIEKGSEAAISENPDQVEGVAQTVDAYSNLSNRLQSIASQGLTSANFNVDLSGANLPVELLEAAQRTVPNVVNFVDQNIARIQDDVSEIETKVQNIANQRNIV